MLVWKAFDSLSNLPEGLAGWSILGCRFFHFITLNISSHCLLACRVSVEKSADNLMGVPLYIICHFSLVAFNILSLSLIFVCLITMCLRCSEQGHLRFQTSLRGGFRAPDGDSAGS